MQFVFKFATVHVEHHISLSLTVVHILKCNYTEILISCLVYSTNHSTCLGVKTAFYCIICSSVLYLSALCLLSTQHKQQTPFPFSKVGFTILPFFRQTSLWSPSLSFLYSSASGYFCMSQGFQKPLSKLLMHYWPLTILFLKHVSKYEFTIHTSRSQKNILLMYNLKLPWRLESVKSSWATSFVRELKLANISGSPHTQTCTFK